LFNNFPLLLEKKIYLFAFSLILFFIASIGPPNVQVLHIFETFKIPELIKLYNESESFFRMPDTRTRFILYFISILTFLSIIFLPSKSTKDISHNRIIRVLIYIFLLTILSTNSLYNYSAILLILYSIYYLIFYSSRQYTKKEIILMSSYFILYFIPFVHALYFHTSLSETDNYLRFLLVIPLYILIREIDLDIYEFMNILYISSIVIGITAFYFLLTDNLTQLRGFTSSSTIFGNISFLFAMMSILSFNYYIKFNKNYLLPSLAILLSLFAWTLTASRGPLIALIFISIFYLLKYPKISFKVLFPRVFIILMLFITTLIIFSNIPNRISQAYYSTYNYVFDDKSHTWKQKDSLIPRYIIWEGSAIMIKKNTFTGVGLNNFNLELNKLITNKSIPPVRNDLNNPTAGMNHAHNQYLDIFAKTGIFGFLSLLFFLIMNFYNFKDGLKHKNEDCEYFAMIGLTIIIVYSSYMFTHTILSHQQSTLFMTVLLTIISGLMTNKINNKKQI